MEVPNKESFCIIHILTKPAVVTPPGVGGAVNLWFLWQVLGIYLSNYFMTCGRDSPGFVQVTQKNW